MENMIDVTDIPTINLVKAAFNLSKPVGMGFLHYEPGDMPDEMAQDYINSDGSVYMDYVQGRQCKFHVKINDGKKYIRDTWYDRTPEQLNKLLEMAKSI